MSIPESARIPAPNPYKEYVPHELKNADIEPVKPLSVEVMESVDRLFAEILSPDSDAVMLDSPRKVRARDITEETPEAVPLSKIDFVDVETYHEVIDRFLLNFGENPRFVKDKPFCVDIFVKFENPKKPESPVYARVYVVTQPVVDVTHVTIMKVPYLHVQ